MPTKGPWEARSDCKGGGGEGLQVHPLGDSMLLPPGLRPPGLKTTPTPPAPRRGVQSPCPAVLSPSPPFVPLPPAGYNGTPATALRHWRKPPPPPPPCVRWAFFPPRRLRALRRAAVKAEPCARRALGAGPASALFA